MLPPILKLIVEGFSYRLVGTATSAYSLRHNAITVATDKILPTDIEPEFFIRTIPTYIYVHT